MDDILQLNLLMPSAGGQVSGQRKTPMDVGESLFKDFLTGTSDNFTVGKTGRAVGGENPVKSGSVKEEDKDSSDPLDALDKKFRYLGLPAAQLRLPGGLAGELARFLEKQGIGRAEIDQLILSATGKDGMIHLGKLMAGLKKENRGGGLPENPFLVASEDVPGVESALRKMGLDIGTIKDGIEKSLDAKGSLNLGQLAEKLSQLIPGGISEKRLVAMLDDFGIKSRPEGAIAALQDPELKKILEGFSEASTEDVQRRVKQELAQMLRQKGVPPQEVKSFLENLSVKYSKSLLAAENGAQGTTGKELSEREASHLLGRVVIRTGPEWGKGGWHEKILDILQKENLIGKLNTGKNWFEEDGKAFRLNLADLVKTGDEGKRFANLQETLIHGENQAQALQRAKKGKPEENPAAQRQEIRGSFEIKDPAANDIQGIRTGRDAAEVRTVNAARTGNALPQPLPKILDRMIWMIRGGEQKGSIHISPPELGKLDLELVIKQGHLQANLNAENPAVKEIIEANLNQLKQQLQDQGFVVEKFSVTVGQDQQRSPEDRYWSRPGRRGRGGGKQGMPLEAAAVSAKAALHSVNNLNQVDVHV